MKKTIEETTRLLVQGTLTKDEADKILLDLQNVSNRRELLIDFFIKQHQNLHRFNELVEPESIVDEYLKGNL